MPTKIFNKESSKWVRPWELEQFDNLYNRDERFFSLVLKGMISWLNRNIIMYNKPINHFIFNTGSSYMYIEQNGYEFSWSETSGEDQMYMHLPRCLIEIQDISMPTDELSQGYSRGVYERQDENYIKTFSAEIKRIPIELNVNLRYVFSNFNESIVVLQEIIDKLIYQKYFTISYLGKAIQCSIEFPGSLNPELNKIDMSSPEPNQKNLVISVKICTNYPIINEKTSIEVNKVIKKFAQHISTTKSDVTGNEYGNRDNEYKYVED